MNDPRRGATSASNAQADFLCPGRHRAQMGIPEPPASDEAQFGLRVHAALAEPPEAGGVLVAALTLEERETYDRCQEIEKKLVCDIFGLDHPPMKVVREQRFWAKLPSGIEHSGQPDVVYRAGDKALILDVKSGRNEVQESPRNAQLRDLAVLVRCNLLILDVIGVAIIQPWVTMKPEICVYTTPDIDRAEEEMWKRVAASNDPLSPRVAGQTQCQYCRAKSQCVEYQVWAGSMLPDISSLIHVPASKWTPQQRAQFLDRAGAAQKWLDDRMEEIKTAMMEDPTFAPGWKLKPGAKREIINDPQACHDRFLAAGGDSARFIRTVTIKKSELRTIVSEVTGLKGKALDAKLDEILQGIVDVKLNAPSIVKDEGVKAG